MVSLSTIPARDRINDKSLSDGQYQLSLNKSASNSVDLLAALILFS